MQSKQRAHNACVFCDFRQSVFCYPSTFRCSNGLTEHAKTKELLELLMLNEMRRN